MSIATAPLWLALSPAALAGQIVVHEGDPATAINVVVERTGQPASDFTALSLQQILDGKLPTITSGKIERCATGAVPVAEVEKHLAAAEESIAAKDYEFVLGPAKAAEKAALCADAPVAPPLLARLAYASGVAAHANGDPEAAKVAFRQAEQLEPAKDWIGMAPEAMQADVRTAVESATRTEVTLSLVPSDGATIDGKPATAENSLAAGPHWIDHAGTWMRVTLDPSMPKATLLIPAAIAKGSTAWAADPGRGGDLARLLDALSPGVTYVVVGDTVYRRDTADTWEKMSPPKKPFEAGYVLTPVGAVMAAGGAVLAFTALGAGNDAVDTATTPGVSQEAFDAARSDYDGAKSRLIVGDILMVSGVVLAGVGGGLLLEGASIGPIFVPGGAGLGLSVGGAR